MSHTDYLGYQYLETTRCFMTIKRDMLYYLRCAHIDGKYVQAALSVTDPDYPPHSSITRVELYKGTGFVLEPYRGSGSNTLVHYLGNVDLKGLPPFIMYQVLKRHPLSIHYMRRHFQHLQTERQEQLTLNTLEVSPSKSGQCFEESLPVGHFLSVPPLNPQKQATSEPVLSQNPSKSSDCDSEERSTLKSSLSA